MEESEKALYTYFHILSMVGFVNNTHYKGVVEVRKSLDKVLTREDAIKEKFSMSLMGRVTNDQ